jgi:hypothetical protein
MGVWDVKPNVGIDAMGGRQGVSPVRDIVERCGRVTSIPAWIWTPQTLSQQDEAGKTSSPAWAWTARISVLCSHIEATLEPGTMLIRRGHTGG